MKPLIIIKIAAAIMLLNGIGFILYLGDDRMENIFVGIAFLTGGLLFSYVGVLMILGLA